MAVAKWSEIEKGDELDADIVMGNFEFLSGKISSLITDIEKIKTDVTSSLSTVDENVSKSILSKLYPVGSIYTTTLSETDFTTFKNTYMSGTTWVRVASGKALWTGNGTSGSGSTSYTKYADAPANTTIGTALPNIKGRMGNTDVNSSSATGCFYRSGTSGLLENNSGGADPDIYFDASKGGSTVYKDAAKIAQPPAYVVNVFRRTA